MAALDIDDQIAPKMFRWRRPGRGLAPVNGAPSCPRRRQRATAGGGSPAPPLHPPSYTHRYRALRTTPRNETPFRGRFSKSVSSAEDDPKSLAFDQHQPGCTPQHGRACGTLQGPATKKTTEPISVLGGTC